VVPWPISNWGVRSISSLKVTLGDRMAAMSEGTQKQAQSRFEQVRQARIDKLERLRELRVDPYPSEFAERVAIAAARERALGDRVRVAGRLMLVRRHGRSAFATLRDQSGEIQLHFSRDTLGDDSYDLVKLLDIGDFAGVEGALFTTKTGELTIEADQVMFLSKSLRPLPEKYHGLTDPEARIRQRYLSFIMDPDERHLFEQRAAFVRNIRSFLDNDGFLEVATPALERVPGGADAEPFMTHYNALDTDFYLRISLELAHKRMIVGGFERIYEIGRVFRNEGIGREHLQDYDLLELYQAYTGFDELKRWVERFYTSVIQATFGTLKLRYGEHDLDFTPPWPESEYFELFRERGVDLTQYATAEALLPVAREHAGADAKEGLGRGRLIDLIYKRSIRPTLIRPQFLVGHPVDVSPLAKRRPDDPSRVQRLQVLTAGSEVGNGFAELNDPLDQRARFEEQQRLREAGDAEAQMLDEDFLEAIEYGMPPTAGFGVSIERWFMYLTNRQTIRETVSFPMTRPEA
jgi:lysyl-tRNA synthetase class 2